MEIKEAIARARQILDEERIVPTVAYVSSPSRATDGVTDIATSILANLTVHQLRQKQPREVLEDAGMFSFRGTNHELLRALFSQVPLEQRPAFLRYLSINISSSVGAIRSTRPAFPTWNSLTSELPLIAEFLVRNGGKGDLFVALEIDQARIRPGHVLLLLQLEELISLNFTQFTEREYEQLSLAVSKIEKFADAQTARYRKDDIRETRWPEIGSLSATGLSVAIAKSCAGIREQCRKARYFYLKGALQEGLNLEVNQDKTAVETYIQQFQFNPSLVEALNEAERSYLSHGTPFDSKSSLGHLRSFLENLQKEAMPSIHGKYGGEAPVGWGGGLAYLLKHKVFSQAEEQFAASLFRLISDEGVHPLIAKREYVRLARNVVIEYSLLFLTKIEKFGLIGNPREGGPNAVAEP